MCDGVAQFTAERDNICVYILTSSITSAKTSVVCKFTGIFLGNRYHTAFHVKKVLSHKLGSLWLVKQFTTDRGCM